MDGVRAAFAAVLIASAVLGGITVADFGNRLDATDTTGVVKSQVTTELVDATVREDRFVATVRFENPTKVDLRVLGAKLRVFNDSEGRLVSGPADRLDDNGETLPGGGSLTATYAVSFAEPERGRVLAALEGDATLAMSTSMRLGDVQFAYIPEDKNVTAVYEEGS